MPGTILTTMPPKSWLVCVGSLTNQRTTFESTDLRWSDKYIGGLHVLRWLGSLSDEERQKHFAFISEDIKNGGKIFGTAVSKTVPLEEWEAHILESEKDASQGKYLVKCD